MMSGIGGFSAASMMSSSFGMQKMGMGQGMGMQGMGGGGERPSFESVDADQSGGWSLEEFTSNAPSNAADGVEELFSKLDADGDGSLTKKEVASIDEMRSGGGMQGGGQSGGSGGMMGGMMGGMSGGGMMNSAMSAMVGMGASGGADIVSLFEALSAETDETDSVDEAAETDETDDVDSAEDSDVASALESMKDAVYEHLFEMLDADEDGDVSDDEKDAFVDDMREKAEQREAALSAMAEAGYAQSGGFASMPIFSLFDQMAA